jgi:hypothetical protein
MGAVAMSDLPPGFVLDTQPTKPGDLPAGFVMDNAPASFNDRFAAVSDRKAFDAVNSSQQKKPFGLADTWPVQAAKAIYNAVTLPGDVYQGNVPVVGADGHTNPEVIDRAADLAQTINPVATLRGTGAGIARAAGLGKPQALTTPTVAELKTAAKAGYESPAVKSLEVKPQALADFVTGLKSRINEMGLDDTLAPKTFTILGNVEKVPPSALMTGQNLRTLQKTLGKASMAADPQERLAATKALIELNKHLENFPSAGVLKGSADDFASVVRRANANYSAAKTAEGLDKKLVSAQLRADSSNSGMNTANAIRQNLRQVITKPKEARGLTQSELDTAKGIVEGGRLDNTVRGVGNLLSGGGGLGAALTAAIGGAAGGAAAGPVGGAIGASLPLAGYAFKALSNRMTVRQAQNLEQAIRSRAPLASSITKYEEKAAAFERAKNTRTFSDLALASRNLKNNLATVGIGAQMRDLMNYSNQSE